MNITTRQLTAFVHAARHLSFTRAAEQMHISQAGLSLMIRELENQIGCRLFDRTTRSILLTAAGQRLLLVAERALEELSSAISELDQLGARLRKIFRVGTTPLLASTLMPPVHQAFRRLRPEITLRVIDAGLEEVHRRVASGELDCGLGTFPKNVPGIARSLLFRFDLLHVRPIDHAAPEASASHSPLPSVRWSDLAEVPAVQLPPGNPLQELIAKELKKNGVVGNATPLMFNHMETIIGMVSTGAGAAIIPSIALAMCRNDAVGVARLVAPALKVGLYLITKRGKAVPEVLPEFTDLLVRTLRLVLRERIAATGGRKA